MSPGLSKNFPQSCRQKGEIGFDKQTEDEIVFDKQTEDEIATGKSWSIQ